MARANATGTTTSQGNPGWLYVGRDERGRELDVVAVEITSASDEAVLLIIHVMPLTSEEAAQMSDHTPPTVTDDSTIGQDLDLDEEDVRLTDGTRLTNEVADGIVEHLRRSAGRPSLSGQAAASPQIAFRVAPAVRERAATLAAQEGKTISEFAREALEARIDARAVP